MIRPLLLLFSLHCCNSSFAATLNIAAASNFKPTLEKLVIAFDPQQQHNIRISSASSGTLFAQIMQGAPFQLFLSADEVRPALLEEKGRVLIGSRTTYALGLLAYWSPSKLSLSQLSQLNCIAMANPRVAPYGLAAEQALAQLPEGDKPKRVMGNNIAQAFQFVATGNCDAGLVAASQLISQGLQGELISPRLYQPIKQQLVQLLPEQSLATEFRRFIVSPEAKEIILEDGYALE